MTCKLPGERSNQEEEYKTLRREEVITCFQFYFDKII